MTVCVATLCEDNKALVFGTDREIGLSYVKGELGTQKVRKVHKNWAMMIAGNDIAPAYDVSRYAQLEFQNEEPPIRLDDAIKCMTNAFKKKRIEDAEALYLAPRGWTLDEFKKDGHARMPLPLYMQIDSQLERNELQITLLVAGFDDFGRGHIFTVHDPGIAERHDAFGFHSIGSGGVNATNMLFYRKASPNMKISKALYCVFEAKTSGERAPGVGEETDMWVMTPRQDEDANVQYVGQESRKTMKKLWNKVRPKELKPADLAGLTKLSEVGTYERDFARIKAQKEAKEAEAAPSADADTSNS